MKVISRGVNPLGAGCVDSGSGSCGEKPWPDDPPQSADREDGSPSSFCLMLLQ